MCQGRGPALAPGRRQRPPNWFPSNQKLTPSKPVQPTLWGGWVSTRQHWVANGPRSAAICSHPHKGHTFTTAAEIRYLLNSTLESLLITTTKHHNCLVWGTCSATFIHFAICKPLDWIKAENKNISSCVAV